MRAFIAIKLPLDIQNTLAQIQDKLKTTLPQIAWTKPANLHLSLKFLGEISLAQLQTTQRIIAEIVSKTLPFEIKLETLGVFPDYRRARIIWIGTDQAPLELKLLAGQIEAKLSQSVSTESQHPFQAHITLGRVKKPALALILKKELKKIEDSYPDGDLKFNTKGVTFFQSVLGPGGPTYSILKELTFQEEYLKS